MTLGVDQYGNRFYLDSKAPRKSLLEQLGRKHADKMYRDTPAGPRHVGYVIAGHWVELFDAWRKPAA